MKKYLFTIVVLLVLSILGIYKVIHRPYMTIKIKYDDVPPVITGFLRGKIDAYYRGFYVGQVSSVELSGDQKYVVFNLDIYYKNLKLPKNIKIFLNSEDVYGARHLSLNYPKNPSSQYLSDGDTIYGTGAYERIDKYLVKELENGRLGKLIDNSLFLTDYAKDSIKKLSPEIQAQIGNLVGGLPETLNKTVTGLQNVNTNIPVASYNISQASREIARASGNISNASNRISNVNRTISRTNSNISNVGGKISAVNEILPEIDTTIDTTNVLLSSTNCSLSDVNSKIPQIPPGLLENTNLLVNKANCLTDELPCILGQRFLLFKLLFGNPAAPLKKCVSGNCGCPFTP